MNKYKIEIKEILKRNVEINANNETEALDFIEKAFLKSNMIDMDFNDLESVETKIIEKNGYEIEHLEELSENDFDENNYDNEEIFNNYSLEKLEKFFQKIKKQIENNDEKSKILREKMEQILECYEELIEMANH